MNIFYIANRPIPTCSGKPTRSHLINQEESFCVLSAVPWSLYSNLQQYGEPEAPPLGGHLCALHVFLLAHLHSDWWVHVSNIGLSPERSHLLTTSTFSFTRCVWLLDLWARRSLRYSDVISWKWCGDDHLQAAFWSIDHHDISHYSSAGEVIQVSVEFVWFWGSSCCLCVEQICDPEPGATTSKKSSGGRHSFVWESLQSRSDYGLDLLHASDRHVCPRHGRRHQRHWRNQCLLHLHLPWQAETLFYQLEPV